MKDILLKIAGFVIIFTVAVFIISTLTNRGSTDMTVEMEGASLPVVSIAMKSGNINKLHGYTSDVDLSRVRSSFVPLPEGRRLSFHIRKYGAAISNLYYEVRSLDGTRLVERTDIMSYTEKDDSIDADITIKDLIEEGAEYYLCICLNDVKEREVKYYTRIMYAPTYTPDEMTRFVRDFTTALFNKDSARAVIEYLESDSTGDNTNYAYVNIHSSFDQVTWGELHPELISDLDTTIFEMDENGGSFVNSYRVEAGTSQGRHEYEIEEYYRLRYTEERIYLLEYERTMKEVFVPDKDHFANDKIMLGITSPDVQMMENNDGDSVAFVQNGSLYCFRNSSCRIVRIYSFVDDENDDERTRFNEHEIKLLSVDEGGNIRFLIYGYMNRGRHEGEVCALVYYYDSSLNTIEEEIYIPYPGSFAYLKSNLDLISYADNFNNFYMYLDGSIYRVRLATARVDTVYTHISEDDFVVSESGATVAWADVREGVGLDTIYAGTQQGNEITLLNLSNGVSRKIGGDSDRITIPVGFIGEDFIYGESDPMGIIKTAGGTTSLVMKALYIENAAGDVLKTYDMDGIYISDVAIDDRTINLSRIIIDRETGTFTPTDDDQIMGSGDGSRKNSMIVLVSTEDLETIVEIQVIQNIRIGSLQLLTPREVLFEGGREVTAGGEFNDAGSCYVFSKGRIYGIYSSEAEAVEKADEVSGVVVYGKGKYLWKKAVRKSEYLIKDITAEGLTGNDMADCINAVFKFEDKEADTAGMLAFGETPINVMKKGLTDKKILTLEGCSLDEVLYYVSLGYPVLAPAYDGDTLLITGYDTQNTVVLDPAQGSVHKIGINDSRELFASRGNVFISYIDEE